MKHYCVTALLLGCMVCFAAQVELPKVMKIKKGESIGVNALFEGSGRFRFGIVELDKNGKELKKTMKLYYGRNCPDSRTFVAVIQHPATVQAKAIYQMDKGSSIQLKHIKFSHLSKEMTQLYSVKENRKLWFERTKGVNLVAGKRLSFSPSTKSYALTYKGGTDETDLTDGKFGRDDDQIWFDGRAVAWSNLKLNLSIIADLGKVQKVEKAVIRIVGGKFSGSQRYSNFPPVLEAWVSKDGKNYYLARRLTLLGEAEKADADWKTLYYLPQTTDNIWPSYVYPFELTIQADARYVVIRSPKQHYMATDEMAVIQAEKKTPAYNNAYKGDSVPLFHTTAILSPYYPKFYVAKDVYLPNLLKMDDKRPNRGKPLSYELDLPAGLKFYDDPNPPWPTFTRIKQGSRTVNGRTIYRFGIKNPNEKMYDTYLKYGIGPFYIKAEGKVPAKQMYAEFRTLEKGKVLYTKRVPLEILQIKPVPFMKKLSIGPAFFFERYLIPWPEFYKAMRVVGFNTLRFDYLSPKSEERYAKLYHEGVKQGFRFRGQMSATACIQLYAAQDKFNINEMRCQFPGSDKYRPNTICPSYRGKYYQMVLDLLKTRSVKYPMEFISFDEEPWVFYRSGDTFTKCSRCDALRKSKNMTWKEFVPWVQADFLSGYYKAVTQGRKNPPSVGYYNVHPGFLIGNSTVGNVYHNGFDRLYPAYCDELQPSMYSSNTRLVHANARKSYLWSKRRPEQVHLWLSAGVGAYSADDYKRHTMYQVLESFMNGASGIQYYLYQSFTSPRDYAYMAEALRLVAPYEELLMKGSLDSFSGSNKNLFYTSRTWQKKSLVLVGNYGYLRAGTTILPLKGRITDLQSGKKYTANGKFTCTVPADSCRFFLVEK